MCKVVVPESQLSLAIGKRGRTLDWRQGLQVGKIDLSSIPDNEIKKGDKTLEAAFEQLGNELLTEEDMENEVSEILNDSY